MDKPEPQVGPPGRGRSQSQPRGARVMKRVIMEEEHTLFRKDEDEWGKGWEQRLTKELSGERTR